MKQLRDRLFPVVEAIQQRFDRVDFCGYIKSAGDPEAAKCRLYSSMISVHSVTWSTSGGCKTGVTCLWMHMQGEPRTMQHSHPHYQNVVREVYAYLEAQVARCVAAGIEKIT